MRLSLLICVIAGAVASGIWQWRYCGRFPLSRWATIPLTVFLTAAGLACVKLFSALESFDLSGHTGMRLYGAILFMPIVYLVLIRCFRWNAAAFFDVQAPAMISMLWFGRINCMISGCCRGLLLPGSDVLRWPTREAELAFHGVLLAVFARRLHRQEQPGALYPLYMIAYGTFRFVIEWFREGETLFLGLHPAHIWSLLSVVIGGSIYFELRERDRRRAVGGKKGGRKP